MCEHLEFRQAADDDNVVRFISSASDLASLLKAGETSNSMCSIPDILKEQTQVGWKDRDVLLQAPESLCQLGFDIRGFKGTLGPDATSRVAPPVWIGTLKSLHFTAPHFAFLTEILKDVGHWFRDDKQPPGIGTLVFRPPGLGLLSV